MTFQWDLSFMHKKLILVITRSNNEIHTHTAYIMFYTYRTNPSDRNTDYIVKQVKRKFEIFCNIITLLF